jgi:PKD repeat protein
MRSRSLATAVALLLLGGGAAAPAIAAAAPTTLFVNNTGSVTCSDAGTGTQAQPFCTVQAAVDVVNPGQTVAITGTYSEAVTVTRSGTAGAPVVIDGGSSNFSGIFAGTSGPAVTVRGAHDVAVRNMQLFAAANAVDVDGSTNVTVDSNSVGGSSGSAIGVTNGSSSVTLSRNRMESSQGPVIRVDAGGSADTIVDNLIDGSSDTGISVAGTPHSAITSNTVVHPCYTGVSVTGASAGTTIENNIVQWVLGTDNDRFSCFAGPVVGGIVVDSTAAASGVVDDYNMDFPLASAPEYVWAGTVYATTSAFAAATGQGAHDLDIDPKLDLNFFPVLLEGSPAIDSANAGAPGELNSDVDGQPRVNDPLVPDTGAGARGIDDRGAFEKEDSFISDDLTVSATQAPVGGVITVSGTFGDAWSEPFTCAIDYGDGTKATVSPCSATHAYAKPGSYQITADASNAAGLDSPFTKSIKVVKAGGSLTAKLHLAQTEANGVTASVTSGSDPWNISSVTYDYGDGTDPITVSSTSFYHAYFRPGTYTVKATVTDANGAVSSATGMFTTAGTDFTPYGPLRLLDTTTSGKLAAHGTLRLKIGGNGAIPRNVAAAALNVTVSNPTGTGFLEAYPDGTKRPTASNLTFAPGRTVANMTITTVGQDGYVDIYNGSNGTVDVAADVSGYFTHTAANGYQALLVDRLLDTRGTTAAPVAGGTAARVTIAGADNGQIPTTGVTAAVLNVTVANPAATGTVTAFPDGGTVPTTPNLSYSAGQTVSNTVIVPVGPDGMIDLRTSATTDLVADVVGFFSQDGFRSHYVPITAVRAVDTRDGTGETTPAPIPAGTVDGFPLDRLVRPPSTEFATFVLNATVTNTTGPGTLTVFESTGAPPPAEANQSWTAGQTMSNLAFSQTNSNLNGPAPESFYNSGATPVDVIVDVFGYFAFTPAFR